MKKINIYEIYKFSTDRLCRNKYNLNITYEQAQMNGEVVGLGSSQVLRKIREICKYDNSDMFIKEYIAIKVEKKSHYKKITNSGVKINGHKYVRFLCGAGNARNSTVFLIRQDLFKTMFEIMSCGCNPKELALAKWNAYFALNASSTYEISKPKVCVIPDYTIDLKGKFDFIDAENNIDEKDHIVKDYCVFDGMGIMSVEYARQIDIDMELGYSPSCVVLRNTFIKGCVATMDIKMFCRDVLKDRNSNTIKDLWGNQHALMDLDIILTESQFKMWKEYNSWEEYESYSDNYNMGWGVTILSHEIDDDYTFTNYQFLQVLDLDDKQVENLCKPTIDWIRDIAGDDVNKLLLYYLGTDNPIEPNKIDKYDIKSLLYNHDLVNDKYIKTRILRSLNKKIRQAYSGKLLVNGNFSFLICDPYAFLEYASGLEVKGLLQLDKYYNGYWNRKEVSTIAGMRSPLTFASEVNIMDLENNAEVSKWYKHIDNCCTVINIYGTDTMKFADADFDGDKLATTNCQEIIDGYRKEFPNPITYDKKSVSKEELNVNRLGIIDSLSFGSKIGFITNCSTYWWSLIANYDKNSLEYNELIHRLKLMRLAQGAEIDRTKGLESSEMPKEYTTYMKDMDLLDKELVASKKPYFQKYIYPKLNYEYNEFLKNSEYYSHIKYGVSRDSNTDEDFIGYMKYHNPILDNNSVMNRICHYLEDNISEIKNNSKITNQEILDDILINTDREILFEYEDLFREVIIEYKQFRAKEKSSTLKYSGEEEINRQSRFNLFRKSIRKKVYGKIHNSVDVANLAIFYGYEKKAEVYKDFAWNIFGKEIFENVKYNTNKKIMIPVRCSDEESEFSYLYKNYKMIEVNHEDDF